jgi:hypothetical protein
VPQPAAPDTGQPVGGLVTLGIVYLLVFVAFRLPSEGMTTTLQAGDQHRRQLP